MISVIIVNYKTLDMTRLTISRVLESVCSDLIEVVLVDNDSDDGSYEELKHHFETVENIIWLKNDMNRGFASANNLGILHSRGEYVLILNSDVEVENNTIQIMLGYLQTDPKIGAIGPKIVLSTGELDHTCKRGFPTPMSTLYYFLKLHKLFPDSSKYGHYTMSHIGNDEVSQVDALVGAFMMLPKIVIDDVGMLDDTFFMYGEDLDWCYRIKQKGYKIYYYPKTTVLHHKGFSSNKKSYKLIYEFYRAMWIFYTKHYAKKKSRVVSAIVFFGIGTILCIKIILNFFKGRSN